jgi:hypothetical protein
VERPDGADLFEGYVRRREKSRKGRRTGVEAMDFCKLTSTTPENTKDIYLHNETVSISEDE